MSHHWLINLIIYAFMLGIILSLGSGLYYILFRREDPEKAVKALMARVGLSVLLFLILLFAFAMGWISPHGLIPS